MSDVHTTLNFISWLNISDNRADIKAEKNALNRGVSFRLFLFLKKKGSDFVCITSWITRKRRFINGNLRETGADL